MNKRVGQFTLETSGERFYNVTPEIKKLLHHLLEKESESKSGKGQRNSGILHLFCMHTSCALVIAEAYDAMARLDMENFLKKLAPRNESWYQHQDEGPDDSPSHMKSIILNQNLSLIVDNGELIMGQWQGIFLAEFRDVKHIRHLYYKYVPDILDV